MKDLKLVLLVLVMFFPVKRTYGQSTVNVDVNLNVKHIVDTASEFIRSKYINLHSDLTEGGWNSDAMRDQFLDGYDVYLGRNNGGYPWHLDQLDEDPARPGWPSLADMTNRGNSSKASYAARTSLYKHEDRAGMMIGGQHFMYPNGQYTNPCCGNATPWILEGHEALAEYMANFLTKYYGSGGATGQPRPKFVEVMNEPFVHTFAPPVSNLTLSEMHNVVAGRIHELAPDVMVGGYTSAWPEHNAGDFQLWKNNWKLFIDVAGGNMDFFSVHIYDNSSEYSSDNMYRAGANAEAVLDIIEHYSYLTIGEIIPFNISEYGNFTREMSGTPYTRKRDWYNLRSYSSIMMGLMEKPNLIIKSVPFMLLKATWWSHESGNKYPHRLLRQQYELEGETGTQWVYTELVKFFRLWSDVKGTRIDTRPTDLDIQADAYVSGNRAYVILNNLNFKSQAVKLNFFDDQSNVVDSVKVKHLRLDGDLPVLETKFYDSMLSEVIVGREATMILEYSFADDLIIDQTSQEQKLYADKYLQPIAAGVENVFSFRNVLKGNDGEAVLRLGLGRNHGRSLRPVLKVNDTIIEVPRNFRGYDQKTRDGFFGILEIPIPYELLEDSTAVSVTFEDAGGHISSISMQTFETSKELVRTPRQNQFDAKFTVLAKSSGLPIEGAELVFAGDTSYTDTAGIVVFDSVSEGTYALSAQSAGYLPYSNSSFEHYDYTELVLKLDPQPYKLNFKLTEEDLGIPVYNAVISVGATTVITDADGQTGLELPSGEYSYSIDEPYFLEVSGTLDHDRDTLIEISLRRLMADVKFRIFSNDGSMREPDAVIELGDTSIITNVLGMATFMGLKVDTNYLYTIQKDGFNLYTGSFSMKQDTTIEVNLLVSSTSNLASLQSFRYYPNPVNGKLNIEFTSRFVGPVEIHVRDVSGRLLMSYHENMIEGMNRLTIDLSEIGSGIYHINIKDTDDGILMGRLLIYKVEK